MRLSVIRLFGVEFYFLGGLKWVVVFFFCEQGLGLRVGGWIFVVCL